MPGPFVISLDRLKNGVVQKINTSLSPELFELQEPELAFLDPVQVLGEAYLTDEDLVLHLNASTIARMPCSICNRMIPITLSIENFYHTEHLNELKTPLFDFRSVLRENLLIELPHVVECAGGCPERAALSQHLRRKPSSDEENPYYPFANIKLP
jgi:uncharacterized metal-binding protein YceD (DUF177 family)